MNVHISKTCVHEGQIIFASDWRDFAHVNTAERLDATAAKQIRWRRRLSPVSETSNSLVSCKHVSSSRTGCNLAPIKSTTLKTVSYYLWNHFKTKWQLFSSGVDKTHNSVCFPPVATDFLGIRGDLLTCSSAAQRSSRWKTLTAGGQQDGTRVCFLQRQLGQIYKKDLKEYFRLVLFKRDVEVFYSWHLCCNYIHLNCGADTVSQCCDSYSFAADKQEKVIMIFSWGSHEKSI